MTVDVILILFLFTLIAAMAVAFYQQRRMEAKRRRGEAFKRSERGPDRIAMREEKGRKEAEARRDGR